ncbi:extra-cytoplasmic solute receptor [Cupriavidus necator N-1]|jgi:tripartite-type tricarboxylate transporter receptor subunit TctC|uniref:Extra-cytoplasmic solute receptor n=1 Tax=Cupriavidus necator (strain ATCC 43291 / DSM 13513 / CCUG 52238 / LMG 8453 / N-1) TaxID=1042878 RepID=F8GNL1_CUPNN|nr:MULTISPECIES: tripartite tricarboxylate transporter substrate binding protein [Cupriavidus]AEI79104.1 extra-cytoplasmic solute receptor [Cupriavidus necator N-1]KAI3600310.1 BUG/TctC family periplasmic protein [Cupriavidus necator H850]MDX6008844.1 tripartite tricarboxylate transporter substrate binding protein [Cupriavidus necator]QUN26138.1 tripartite tricarboxylate transporter substrate binding protein [Cupriavidus sp. KK10]
MYTFQRQPALRLHHWLRAFALGSVVTVAALTVSAAAYAAPQDWPQRPVSVVVPFPPGGSSDAIARMLTVPLNEKLGQPFVIDNRPGATGAIGATFVKRAPADGYTMMVASIGVYAVNPFLQKNLAYDPARDFDLLTVAVRAPNVLVANPQFPANTLQELVAYMKKNPGKVSFASSGAGSSDHLTAALFWQKSATDGLHVPYKGGGPAISDLLAGQVDVSFQNVNAVLQHIRTGKLKAMAVTSDKRSPVLPNVPTMAEAGVKDVEVYSWQGVAAPRGLPPEVKSRLHGALVSSLNDPKMRQKLSENGFEVVANTPEQFSQFEAQELQRWKTVIEKGKIALD